MSFAINLYHTGDPVNQLTKKYELIQTVEGTLKEDSSLIDPVILFDGTVADLRFCNAMYIANFKRYYLVKNIKTVRSNLVEISTHVDVLSTYADAIRNNYGIVKRNQNAHNLYLNDGFFKVYQNPHIVKYEFANGFTDHEWVLAMAGS